MILTLPHKLTCRDYQAEVFQALFVEQRRHLFVSWHRRAGKDKSCINLLVAGACERRGTYIYLFPQTNQARRVIWRGMDAAGVPFRDHIPRQIITKTNNSDMSIELINGSIIILGGSNNFDALMGMNPVGIIYSEFSLHNPLARQYLNPILVENGGWEICQGTPRGKNHAYTLFQMAMDDPNWFVSSKTILDTKRLDGSAVITLEQIEAEMRQGVPEEIIRQEYFVEWTVGVYGAYYTKEMNAAENEKRILNFQFDGSYPVYTAWDLGVRDYTAVIFFQVIGDKIYIFDHLEEADKGAQQWAEELKRKQMEYNCRYMYHFGPHDIMQREFGASAQTILSVMSQLGVQFQRVPNVTIQDGINAARMIFPRVYLHKTKCWKLIDCLREYHREYDEAAKVFKDNPKHNWASHSADAFRYLAVSFQQHFGGNYRTDRPRQYEMKGFDTISPGNIPQAPRGGYSMHEQRDMQFSVKGGA